MRLLDVMQPIADEHGSTLSAVALNWARQKDFVDTCIVGAQKRDRVEENARCLQWDLTAEEGAALDEALQEIVFCDK